MLNPVKKVVKVGGTILLIDQAEKLEGDVLHENLTMLSLDNRSSCLFGLSPFGELLAIKMASDERVATIVEAEEDLATRWLSFPGFIRMDGRPVCLDPRVVALTATHAGMGEVTTLTVQKHEKGFTFSTTFKSCDEVTIVPVHDPSYIVLDFGGYTLVGELAFAEDETTLASERIGAVDPDDPRSLIEVDSIFLSTLGQGWRPVPGPGLDRMAG